jgi:hypothetical protein
MIRSTPADNETGYKKLTGRLHRRGNGAAGVWFSEDLDDLLGLCAPYRLHGGRCAGIVPRDPATRSSSMMTDASETVAA